MVSVDKFLEGIDAIEREHPKYEEGHSGDDGFCDCIGLIIGAIRRAGGKWRGLHGSNYAARFEIFGGVEPITSASQLKRGDAVFKYTDDTTNLPDRYKEGGSYYTGDLRDYYHVGVVYSVSPLEIKHCTTNGGDDIVTDTKLGKWSMAGPLTLVDYGGKTLEPWEAFEKGGVNLRSRPDTKADLVVQIPQGGILNGNVYNDEWIQGEYDGRIGYAMRKFLRSAKGDTDTDTDEPAEDEDLDEDEDEEGEEDEEGNTFVVANAKGTVNLRQKPSTSAKVVLAVPVGSDVQVTEDGDDWCKVKVTVEGYMMSKYLEKTWG